MVGVEERTADELCARGKQLTLVGPFPEVTCLMVVPSQKPTRILDVGEVVGTT